MMRIEILVFEGVDDLDALAPLRVLRGAVGEGAPFEVALVTLEPSGQVTTSSGLRIQPDGVLGEAVDILIVPGGGWANRAEHGAWAEYHQGGIPDAIAGLHEQGSVVATVCTGGMLATKAGITTGRPAITHHVAIEELRAAGAEVIQARVVDDGDLVSCGGVTSGIDLALWLIERFAGADVAARVEVNLEYERRGTVWRRGRPDA
jgi:transcriptional regulator GlxA family with amidase domain